MAYRRYRRRRRRTSTFRRRRTYTKRTRYGRRRRRVPDGMRAKRKCYLKLQITGNNTTSYGYFKLNFNLTDLPNYTEFTAMWDFFKITGVKLEYRLVADHATTDATLTGWHPTLVTAPDYSNSTIWSLMSQAMEYPRSRIMTFGHDGSEPTKFTQFIRPSVLNVLARTPTTDALGPRWGQWINTDYANMEHYGIMGAYERLPTGMVLEINCTYYMKFKKMI